MATPWDCSVLKSTPPFSYYTYSLTVHSPLRHEPFPSKLLCPWWPDFLPNFYQHPYVLTHHFSVASGWHLSRPPSNLPKPNSSASSAPAEAGEPHMLGPLYIQFLTSAGPQHLFIFLSLFLDQLISHIFH